MKLLVTGGTGFIGRHVVAEAARRGHEVIVATRSPDSAGRIPPGASALPWDSERGPLPPVEGLEGVVHLAGESVAQGRWTRRKMARIADSRVNGTRNLVAGLRRNPPRAMASASAVGWYGPRGDEELDEHAPHGEDYLSRVCVGWEREARLAGEEFGVKVAVVRIGFVLGRDGGGLPRLVTPFKWFVGGPVGSGAQWMSWIHVDDVAGILLHAVERGVSGTLNATAPEPATNRDFSRALGRVLGRPSLLRTPGWVLRIALGRMAGLAVTGQRVLPRQTLASGYRFRFPSLEPALKDLLAR